MEELIAECDRPVSIFDPFCGTATTALCSAYGGHKAITTDINPFLVWFGKAKTEIYSQRDIDEVRSTAFEALRRIENLDGMEALPPIHNIERWWSKRALYFLSTLKIILCRNSEEASKQRNLLMIAFCRSLISLSSASFNHQSMSFKNNTQLTLESIHDMQTVFAADVEFVLSGALKNPTERAEIVLGDSRIISSKLQKSVDRVITSPPYVNRMSYIRELRPYMYWLDWLSSGREAGELDWSAIGGTWGIATSRLAEWDATKRTFQSSQLEDSIEQIAHADNKNGILLANYVAKYFEDMWLHFQTLTPALSKGAEIHTSSEIPRFMGHSFQQSSILQK